MKQIILLFSLATVLQAFGQDSIYQNTMKSLHEKLEPHYFVEKDSAFFYLDKIKILAKTKSAINDEIEALFSECELASYYFDLSKTEFNLNELERLLNEAEIKSSINYLTFTYTFLYYRGDYFLKLYEYKKSRECFEKIVSAIEQIPITERNSMQNDLYSGSFSFLGKVYMEEGKYELAEQLYKKDIRYLLSKYPIQKEHLYDSYNLLGEVLKEKKLYKNANDFLIPSINYNLRNNNTNTIISSAFNIAENYNHLNQKDSALFYLKVAKSYIDENNYFLPRFHQEKGDFFEHHKEYNKAIEEYETALRLNIEKLKSNSHINIPILHNKIGYVFLKEQQLQKALDHFDLGLIESNKISNNKSILLKLLKNKSLVLNRMDSSNGFLKSIENVEQGVVVLDSLKPSFKSQSDKLLLIDESFQLFESGIEASYQLFITERDSSYLDNAIEFAEKSKAVLLLEALLNTKASKFADIPEDLLEHENQLKSKITFVEKEINSSKTTSPKLEDQLFELKNDHRFLIQNIETNYPDYYDLKYKSEVISATKTQQLLANNEIIISYFYGNQGIYVIGISKDSKKLYKIPLEESIEAQIRSVRQMLGDPKSDIFELAKKSYSLYDKLLQPVIEQTDKTKLIIIPDGLLNYLPFGSLNTKPDGIHYLIEDKTIAYANSVTLWAQLKERKNGNIKLLAFAPSFENNSNISSERFGKLLPLPHNTREVEQILTSFKGDSYLNSEASLSNFNVSLPGHGILHLATHAIFDDNTPEYSYLAFSQNGNTTENLLYVADLYNLQLDADLVTLSACESGIGDLKRGEGFLSLARGFFYSGAASIASTLWKINDASTTTLMHGFYKNLSHGDSKDVALQKAQLGFLNANRENGLSHPYYWSGFVISGNTVPLTNPNNWIWMVIGAILVFGGGFYYLRKRSA
ncbi:MAG: CHAT domain-containing protein [Maribacter sp.]|uniref:CHAT domain-containing protein n=1 Tax=Maribacter sp. TaxID=1897614 RepID=UPI003C7707B0